MKYILYPLTHLNGCVQYVYAVLLQHPLCTFHKKKKEKKKEKEVNYMLFFFFSFLVDIYTRTLAPLNPEMN
jgi:hypothetical protein